MQERDAKDGRHPTTKLEWRVAPISCIPCTKLGAPGLAFGTWESIALTAGQIVNWGTALLSSAKLSRAAPIACISQHEMGCPRSRFWDLGEHRAYPGAFHVESLRKLAGWETRDHTPPLPKGDTRIAQGGSPGNRSYDPRSPGGTTEILSHFGRRSATAPNQPLLSRISPAAFGAVCIRGYSRPSFHDSRRKCDHHHGRGAASRRPYGAGLCGARCNREIRCSPRPRI